jgi:hypothetical protein
MLQSITQATPRNKIRNTETNPKIGNITLLYLTIIFYFILQAWEHKLFFIAKKIPFSLL